MVIDLNDLKSRFNAYDRPTGVDFENLIDTLSTQIDFITGIVPQGIYTNISDSINNGYTFTLSEKQMILLSYSDGLYLFNKTEPGSYGQNEEQVNINQFIHIAPRIDIINDGVMGDQTTYSSEYLESNFPSSTHIANNYVPKTNPGNIVGDMFVNGDVQAHNIIDPSTIVFNSSTNQISFGFYDGGLVTTDLDISKAANTIVTDLSYTAPLNPVQTFNDAHVSYSVIDCDVYIRYTESTSGLQTVYKLVKELVDTLEVSLSSTSDILLIEDGNLEFLNNYSTTTQMNQAIQDASLGFDYSVSSFNGTSDSLNTITGMSNGEYTMVRATIGNNGNSSSYGDNYDSRTDFDTFYSDYVDLGSGEHVVYSPVYKYNGSDWIYEYQMAAQHSHTAADITDFGTAVTAKLESDYLSTLRTDSTSTHLTQAYSDKLAALPIPTDIVTISGNELISGNKTFSGTTTFSALTADRVLEINGSNQLTSVAKATAYNKDFSGTGSASTVSRSDHTHSTYALLSKQIDRTGDSNVGKIGFGCTANSNTSLTAVNQSITSELVVGNYGTFGLTKAVIIDDDSIGFSTNMMGNPVKIQDYSNGTALQLIDQSSRVVARFAVTETSFFYLGESTAALKIASDITMTKKVTITGNEIDYVDGGKAVSYKNAAGSTSNIVIKEKIIEIGVWNMDSVNMKTIYTSFDPEDIISIDVSIIKDGFTRNTPLDWHGSAGNAGNYFAHNSGGKKIELARVTGGYFDSTDYDDATMNRGYIYIKYKA